jgi:hypothetical protein
MKNLVLRMVLFLLVGLLISCGSTQPIPDPPYKPLSYVSNATVIGTVHVQVKTPVTDNITIIGEIVYNALLKVAQERYSENIDIVDITWYYPITLIVNKEVINRKKAWATGKVISLDG